MPIQFIKQIRHLKIIFSIFLCKSEIIIWGFPSFLEKSLKWYILSARTCESCQIASQQGQAWVWKQDELHQSLVVLHQPQACSSQILKPPTEKVQSLWSGCKCGIWSSMPLTNVQWSTLSSFYMVKKSCRSKSTENYVTLVILTSWKGKCVTMVKYFPLLVTPKEWNENSKGNFLPHFSLAWKSLGVLNTIQKR